MSPNPNNRTKQTDTSLLGDAGEHYVAFELARRGVAVSLTPRNAKAIDLLATRDGSSNVACIQVKTSRGRNDPRRWDMGRYKLESKPNCFYVFVNSENETKAPVFFVLQAAMVNPSVQGRRPTFRIGQAVGKRCRDWDWNPITNFLRGKTS